MNYEVFNARIDSIDTPTPENIEKILRSRENLSFVDSMLPLMNLTPSAPEQEVFLFPSSVRAGMIEKNFITAISDKLRVPSCKLVNGTI